MHPSDQFACNIFDTVIHGTFSLDDAIELCNDHSVGARSKFYRLVDQYTA